MKCLFNGSSCVTESHFFLPLSKVLIHFIERHSVCETQPSFLLLRKAIGFSSILPIEPGVSLMA